MEIAWRKDLYAWDEIKESFRHEEYIALNDNFQLTKYDPKIIEIKDNTPLYATNLTNLFEGCIVYQFPKTSDYRPYPLRIVYSKILGKKFELKGTNKDIYEFMKYLGSAKASTGDENFRNWLNDWAQNQLYNYIFFFFDNVAGRKDRFELIDYNSETMSPVDQIINRVNTYHNLQKQDNYDKYCKVEYEKSFKKKAVVLPTNYIALVKKAVNSLLNDNSDLDRTRIRNEGKQIIILPNIFMVFHSTLFKADIEFSFEIDIKNPNQKNSFGEIKIINEKIVVIEPTVNSQNKADIKLILKSNTDLIDEYLSELPYFD